MKYNKLKLSVILIGIGLSANAQEATTASGGTASGSGGTATYSIGQVVYTSNTGTTGSVNQGIQQPYLILGGIHDESYFGFSLVVSPNPTTDKLNLKINKFNNEKLDIQLVDMLGKVLITESIHSAETQIDMSNLSVAGYYLNITKDNNIIKTFKIIKN